MMKYVSKEVDHLQFIWETIHKLNFLDLICSQLLEGPAKGCLDCGRLDDCSNEAHRSSLASFEITGETRSPCCGKLRCIHILSLSYIYIIYIHCSNK